MAQKLSKTQQPTPTMAEEAEAFRTASDADYADAMNGRITAAELVSRNLKPTQVYDDGTEILEGQHVQLTRSGGLLPGYTVEGIAAQYPNATDGVLYLKRQGYTRAGDPSTVYDKYIHLNHGGSIIRMD